MASDTHSYFLYTTFDSSSLIYGFIYLHPQPYADSSMFYGNSLKHEWCVCVYVCGEGLFIFAHLMNIKHGVPAMRSVAATAEGLKPLVRIIHSDGLSQLLSKLCVWQRWAGKNERSEPMSHHAL